MTEKCTRWAIHPLIGYGAGWVYRHRMVPCIDAEGETGTVMKPEWVYDPWRCAVIANASRRRYKVATSNNE
jgi:hypothetical protein